MVNGAQVKRNAPHPQKLCKDKHTLTNSETVKVFQLVDVEMQVELHDRTTHDQNPLKISLHKVN